MITPNLQSKKLQELMREKRSVITCFFLTPKTLNLTPKYKQVLRYYEEKKSVVICLILTYPCMNPICVLEAPQNQRIPANLRR